MSIFNEIVPDIHTWSEFSDEKQLNFNGYYVVREGQSVLIDPPELNPSGLQELEILVSKNSHCPLKAIFPSGCGSCVHDAHWSAKLP